MREQNTAHQEGAAPISQILDYLAEEVFSRIESRKSVPQSANPVTPQRTHYSRADIMDMYGIKSKNTITNYIKAGLLNNQGGKKLQKFPASEVLSLPIKKRIQDRQTETLQAA